MNVHNLGSVALKNVGLDVIWYPVLRITTPLARKISLKRSLMRAARETSWPHFERFFLWVN